MGNFCGTSAGGASPEAAKERVFEITVQKAYGATGNSQLSILQSSLPTNFPNATISVHDLPNVDPDYFEVIIDSVVVHSSQKMGQIQTSMDTFVKNVTALLQQAKQSG